mgnify:CR=1 FL=1
MGFLLLPVFPETWKLGLAAGWGTSWAVEFLTLKIRKAASSPLGASLAAGLILRLVILLLGTAVGKWTGLFFGPAFLFAFLAGFVVGEPLVLWQLSRYSLSSKSVSPNS